MGLEETVEDKRGLVLVIGATGNVGRNVVSRLSELNVPVRALVHNPDNADLPHGVEIVCGDLSEPETLERDLDGVKTVFLVWPALPVGLAPAVIEVLKRRVSRIVYLSSMGVREERVQQVDPINEFHASIERLIEHSGIGWTFLRASGFASNTLNWSQQIRSDSVVRWPYGEATRSLIHERDIAEVAVRALIDDKHSGAKYVLTGPQALTQIEQVQTIGQVIGRQLRYEEVSPEVMRQQFLIHMPSQMVDGMLNAWAEFVRTPEPVTHTVEEIIGRPAHTYREWVSDHAGAFRA
ncbi:nucleotide-diphosphate-sugar epimerase [Dictyobacter sp. S3.2.2.5]|uniref:Nucleotide-diphosphate-sugar epimerase n=1 Tax=Dictyobacter halimunensis TaxID=3026934 RepID=A0ABQ6FIK7_9CHLR|nr:nucleotide-diphosphate-sugar epimerase [Dictyobacter sp. S3.2.2.5]